MTTRPPGGGPLRRRPVARWAHWAFIGLLLTGGIAFCGEAPVRGNQLKAAFLYNFTKFVEWDADAFPAADSPIVIGVFGSESMTDEVRSAVLNRKVNGRGFSVKNVQSAGAAKSVHLLFISAAGDASLRELMMTLRDENVLTVGESAAFSRSGGMITFFLEGGKVHFDINTVAARQASVKISSQLLKLARSARK